MPNKTPTLHEGVTRLYSQAQPSDGMQGPRNPAMPLLQKGSKALALIILVTSLAVTPVSPQNPHQEKFLRQHLDFPRTNVGPDYCRVMMLRRGMTRPCKDTNSFVHLPRDELKAICTWAGGVHYRRALRISRAQVSVTTCKLQRAARGQCFYWAHWGRRHILISCDAAGWPVHFEESNFM
ncbi:angiogenin-2-like [Paroedura picta]|uniref:angiogenin-2-like n=1 Tax=Paroedura picta TaxID=143630 RepID=UPI0040564A58